MDRLHARFHLSIAEVGELDSWNRSLLGLATVGQGVAQVHSQAEKVLHFIEETYLAPIVERKMETFSFNEDFFGVLSEENSLMVARSDRSLAEREGMESWEQRYTSPTKFSAKALSPEDARARARQMRRRRDWEK